MDGQTVIDVKEEEEEEEEGEKEREKEKEGNKKKEDIMISSIPTAMLQEEHFTSYARHTCSRGSLTFFL
jgi:hypothetical protein